MKLSELLFLISLILSIALLLTVAQAYLMPSCSVRDLAVFYLNSTFNPFNQNYTVNSPEAVTAIVWDYRGLDTLFETAVFYLALIAGLMLARGLYSEITFSQTNNQSGLSVIVKTVTKLTTPMIIAVGASIGLHGHLTPGGGFQGGATIAVAPMVMIVVFSTLYLLIHKVSTSNMLLIRSIGLLGIGLTTILALLIGLLSGGTAYVFQNMPKPFYYSTTGLPAYIQEVLISGTLWFFNLFEMFAVAAGFTMAFIVLLLTRGEVKEQ
ncbi:MAG: MnhB domain-containing protein [Desulfurococcaceae archaeon]